jgi:hypothetical protein
MRLPTKLPRRALALLLPLLAAACQGGDRSGRDSTGANAIARTARTADTGNALGHTPAEGGVAQVTPTDVRSFRYANRYELTDSNFRSFVRATDSVLALRGRDPQIRAFLDTNITDTGVDTGEDVMDAGRKRLEANPAISGAIRAAGMSVADYFIAAIAIAQAERFMGNPKAALPTPVLQKNATFLGAHRSDLQALRAREQGAIIVR